MATTGGQRGSKRPRKPAEDGFWPIKQVAVANSIGLPLMLVGMIVGFAAFSTEGDSTTLWLIAGGLFGVGVIVAASNKII